MERGSNANRFPICCVEDASPVSQFFRVPEKRTKRRDLEWTWSMGLRLAAKQDQHGLTQVQKKRRVVDCEKKASGPQVK